MSKSHDGRTSVRLTPANAKDVDAQAKAESRVTRIPVSRNAMTNKAVAIGIRIIKKESNASH